MVFLAAAIEFVAVLVFTGWVVYYTGNLWFLLLAFAALGIGAKTEFGKKE